MRKPLLLSALSSAALLAGAEAAVARYAGHRPVDIVPRRRGAVAAIPRLL